MTKKKPCIPPIYHNNNYITDFKEKDQIFNNFLANQCTLVQITYQSLGNGLKIRGVFLDIAKAFDKVWH